MQVKVSSQVSNADWHRIYSQDPAVTPSQSRVWADVIARSSGAKDRSRHYRFSDGVEAVLPLFTQRYDQRLIRVFRSPPPAWGFGGLFSTSPLKAEHLRAVMDDCARLPCAAVQIRPNPVHADVWAEAAQGTGWQALPRNAHVVNLTGGFDEVWEKRFPGSTRTKIRKAIKDGVTVEFGASEKLIEDFDRLFRISVARWAQGQNEFGWLAALRGHVRDPKKKFASMAHDAGEILRVFIAYIGGEPVAGIIVLMDRNGHYTRGAIDKDKVGQSNASYLLHRMAIEDTCKRSGQCYHMGETGQSRSLASFKTNFGAKAIPYAEYRFERIPILTADQKLRSIVKKLIGFKDA